MTKAGLANDPLHALWQGRHEDCQNLVLATYRPAGSVIRVVIVKETHGWFAFFCTDPTATVVEILEAFADRATIEQDFHDIKEVWGAGQQQVRNIGTNVAVYHLNLWMHTLVELWAWHGRHGTLCDRRRVLDFQVLDFHALRGQFISHLARAGVHPKVAQQLARHSPFN